MCLTCKWRTAWQPVDRQPQQYGQTVLQQTKHLVELLTHITCCNSLAYDGFIDHYMDYCCFSQQARLLLQDRLQRLARQNLYVAPAGQHRKPLEICIYRNTVQPLQLCMLVMFHQHYVTYNILQLPYVHILGAVQAVDTPHDRCKHLCAAVLFLSAAGSCAWSLSWIPSNP